MRVSILCSDARHPIFPWLEEWAARHGHDHDVELVRRKEDLSGGEILFLISCHEIIRDDVRARYDATLVIHASDLPLGRGWSPHIWQILDGKPQVPVSLIEAEDVLDSGAIWAQTAFRVEGHETFNEINAKLFDSELELMDFALTNFGKVTPRPQDGRAPTHYRQRTPEDSRIDPARSIADQFDLLRVADPQRFPAFLEFRGHRYVICIMKDGQHEQK